METDITALQLATVFKVDAARVVLTIEWSSVRHSLRCDIRNRSGNQ
jgi:hypothetical protein